MHDDVARAWAFMRRGDAAGETEESSPLGTVVRDSRVPLRYDSNYLFVERPATAAEVRDELHRLEVPAAVIPKKTLPSGDTSGLDVARSVVMVHRRPAPSASRSAIEVDRQALEPLRRASILAQPWGSPEVADQLLAAKALMAERVTVRFFASFEGDEVVSCADLYQDDTEAQIEDVLTAPEHRDRGHASAVVLRALEEARAAGAEFIFLVASDEDWPKDWYARLGFDIVGRYNKLIATS